MSDETQKMIEQRASKAPRVTPADVEAAIKTEHYFTAEDGVLSKLMEDQRAGVRDSLDCSLGLLTICVLVLHNGFTVTGESACASPENFDAEIGRKVARQNAINKVWPLLGFRLRDRLMAAQLVQVGDAVHDRPLGDPYA